MCGCCGPYEPVNVPATRCAPYAYIGCGCCNRCNCSSKSKKSEDVSVQPLNTQKYTREVWHNLSGTPWKTFQTFIRAVGYAPARAGWKLVKRKPNKPWTRWNAYWVLEHKESL